MRFLIIAATALALRVPETDPLALVEEEDLIDVDLYEEKEGHKLKAGEEWRKNPEWTAFCKKAHGDWLALKEFRKEKMQALKKEMHPKRIAAVRAYSKKWFEDNVKPKIDEIKAECNKRAEAIRAKNKPIAEALKKKLMPKKEKKEDETKKEETPAAGEEKKE